MTTLVRFPTGGALPPASNDENARKLPGRPVRGWDSLLRWLREHPEARNKREVHRNNDRMLLITEDKSASETALDFVAFQMVESHGFPDWRGHEVAEWAYEVIRDGRPRLSERAAREWLSEQLQEEDADDPVDWRGELEEYFRRDNE